MKFVLKRAVDKQYYFVVVASNGETVAQSELYRDKADASHAVDLLKASAAGAVVEDRT